MKECEKIVLGFASAPDYTGNAKAVYEQLMQVPNIDGKYEIKWFVKTEKMKEKLEKMGVQAIWDKQENFKEEFEKVQIMFITHDQYIYQKLKRQIFVTLWHGFGPKRIALLTEGKANFEIEKKFVEKYNEVIDYYMVPSEMAKFVFSVAFNAPNEKLKVYPYSRNKYLFEKPKTELLSHLLQRDVAKFDKVILYAPTYREGLGRKEGILSSQNLLNLEQYPEEKLKAFLKEHNFLLIIQPHPAEESKVEIGTEDNIAYLDARKMEEELVTANEVLNCMDILITDYSSIYIEYLLLNRPILFLDTDYEKYRQDRGILFDNKEFWTSGPSIHTIEDLLFEMEKFLKDETYYQKERKVLDEVVNGKNRDFHDIIDNFILKLEPKIKIPKRIHYFKENENTNLANWKDKLKEYEFVEWDRNAIDKKYEATDEIIVKLKILNDLGGIFLEPSIQIMKDIEDLLFQEELVIRGNYNEVMYAVVGTKPNNPYIQECIETNWFCIDNKENINILEYPELFVSDAEQWRIGCKDFKDTNKYFNITDITLKNKVGRALKYGFNKDLRKSNT